MIPLGTFAPLHPQFPRCWHCDKTFVLTEDEMDSTICPECIEAKSMSSDTALRMRPHFLRCQGCQRTVSVSAIPSGFLIENFFCEDCQQDYQQDKELKVKPTTLADLIEEWCRADEEHSCIVSKLDEVSSRLGAQIEKLECIYVIHNNVGYDYDKDWNLIQTHDVVNASDRVIEASEAK